MKKLVVPSLLAAAFAVSGCGSSSDPVTNPLNGANLSDAEIAAVATQLQAATSEATAAATAQPPALAHALTRTIPLGGEHACPVAGRITRSGNATVTATETAWSVYALVTFHISDPTNNLNDCEVAKGVLLDGTLTLTVAGSSEKGGVGATMSGTIGVNQRGPTGGLVPRGDCFVFLTVPTGGTRATGSVCGEQVK